MRKAGILRSIRGSGGGYLLAKPANEITIRSVSDAVEADQNLQRGNFSISNALGFLLRTGVVSLQDVVDTLGVAKEEKKIKQDIKQRKPEKVWHKPADWRGTPNSVFDIANR